MNDVRGRTTLEGLLIVGLLAALGCGGGGGRTTGGGGGRTTDGGGADTARGTGGGGAKDAATDRHEASDRTSAGDRSSPTDMRPASDARQTGDGACGALGQLCCPPGGTCQGDPATNMCAFLLIPNDYHCIHCGDLSEVCCPSSGGGYCNDPTLGCDRSGQTNYCKTCGLTGNPCCAGANPCSASGACCDPVQGVCVAAGSTCFFQGSPGSGICTAGVCECGHENEPCCNSTPCLDPADQCTTGQLTNTCVPCGIPGNPCCPNNTCANGGCCVYEYTTGSVCVANGATCQTTPTATCSAGTCGSCGGVGQTCCTSPDNICTAPNTYCSSPINAGTCQSCGAAGEPCCAGASFLATGTSCNSGLTCSSTSQATGGTCH